MQITNHNIRLVCDCILCLRYPGASNEAEYEYLENQSVEERLIIKSGGLESTYQRRALVGLR